MNQIELDFFVHPSTRSRTSDPVTSKLAAQQVNASVHYGLILEALQKSAAGIHLISVRSGLDVNQIARRLPELQKQGIVKLTGKLVVNKNNRKEREWCLT